MKINSRSYRVAELIRDREPFQTHGALRAEKTPYGPATTGWLDGKYYDSAFKASYVVYSYATPIAWYSDEDGWTVPDEKYSMTTSHHQGKLYLIPREDDAA